MCEKLTATNPFVTLKSMNRSNASSDAADLLKNPTLYREFLAEKEEILRHKWYESEKQGRDIGFERALLDWMLKHRTPWRQSRAASKGMS
jgi:hypothetical protein